MLKRLITGALLGASPFFFHAPVLAQSFKTVCNLRYNNLGIIHGNVACSATFFNSRLHSVSFVYPTTQKRYSWQVGEGSVTADPRWGECVRHTGVEGNQWQVCTIPNFQQLINK